MSDETYAQCSACGVRRAESDIVETRCEDCHASGQHSDSRDDGEYGQCGQCGTEYPVSALTDVNADRTNFHMAEYVCRDCAGE